MNKVPQITLAFWIMKIAATTLGETAGDLLSMTLHVGYALSSLILIGIFIATLVAQLTAKSYHPVLFWTVILSTSTAGTTMSGLHGSHPGPRLSGGNIDPADDSPLCARALAFHTLGSLSVDHIHTFKVEAFYWITILFSNTLGTALGDFLSDSSGFGFAGGALLIGGALALIILAHFFTPMPKTLLFWLAFVLTRPFGATMGDLLTKSHEKGGFGFGTIGSSLVLAFILVFLILLATKRKLAPQSIG